MFLNSINYFRGIAIVFIVTGHCYDELGWRIDSFGEKFVANIISSGGAVFFVFISGFLFFHVFYRNFNYKNFIIKKMEYILIPYLVLSSVQIAYSIFRSKNFISSDYVSNILFSYVTGATNLGYYYIPFIMIIFLLSPLFISFIRTNISIQIFLILITLSIALIVQRPIADINIFQYVIYFIPVYLLGIFCSMYKEYIYKIISGREYVLLFLTIFLAAFQTIFYSQCGNFEKELFKYNGIDISLLQKIILTLFFMSFMHRFENVNSPVLNFLAKVSFPIYFLHPYILKAVKRLNIMFPVIFASYGGILLCSLLVVLVVGSSAMIAVTIKRFLPNYSMFVIGR